MVGAPSGNHLPSKVRLHNYRADRHEQIRPLAVGKTPGFSQLCAAEWYNETTPAQSRILKHFKQRLPPFRLDCCFKIEQMFRSGGLGGDVLPRCRISSVDSTCRGRRNSHSAKLTSRLQSLLFHLKLYST